MLSSVGNPQMPRDSSRSLVTLPIARDARRRASASGTPSSINARVFPATCCAISSRSSSSSRSRRSHAVRCRNMPIMVALDDLCRTHDAADGGDEAVETGLGLAERAAAGAGQAVVAGPAVVRRLPPLGGDQALDLQALQRRIEGS